jgi:glycolate oxidase FAD binding subunit
MSLDSTNPGLESAPSTSDALRTLLVDNFAGAKRAIVPLGGGTSLEGDPATREGAITVITRGLNRVVEFAPRDMTITVEAGISIARLDEILRGEGLRLPIDIPQWDRATLGGALAANASGPRRFGLGTFRDYVIGLTAVKADGQVFHSGGRVVKNVAGYDLCKLLAGSFGSLAIVTQVTLKLKPIPESSALVCAAFADLSGREAAVAALLNSETRPVAIDTLNTAAANAVENRIHAEIPVGGGPLLIVGYEGTQRETDWQTVTLLNELVPFRPLGLHVLRNADAGPLWAALTEFPVRRTESLVFEAHLLPSKIAEFEAATAILPLQLVARAGNGTIYGKLAAPPSEVEPGTLHTLLPRLSSLAFASQGAFEILHGDPTLGIKVSNAGLAEGARALMQRLKASFDPENLLNYNPFSAP